MTRVCEHWHSEELKITILSKCSDPRYGSSVTRLENLDRSEPDLALFQVPPDYEIVEETGRLRSGLGRREAYVKRRVAARNPRHGGESL